MSAGWWTQSKENHVSFLVKWLPELVGLIRLVPAVRRYFDVSRRRVRASLISQLAQDALALIALQRGVSLEQAAQLDELIEEIEAKIVGEGVDPAKARSIAKSAAAGALAKLRAREELLGGQ
jgi:hypothetical protein